MARGMTPLEVDRTEVWKLAAALGQAHSDDPKLGRMANGEINPWTDTLEAAQAEDRPLEMHRLRALGLPIPPPPMSDIGDVMPSPS